MRKRRRLPLRLGLLGSLAVALGFAVWLLWPPEPGLTPENFARLREGMSPTQAAALLGEPSEPPVPARWTPGLWEGEGCWASLTFDETGALVAARLFRGGRAVLELEDAPEPLSAKLRRWLGL